MDKKANPGKAMPNNTSARDTEEMRSLFLKSADVVAPQLIGKLLCVKCEDGTVKKYRITETEAYCQADSAAHSFKGKTNANKSMFMIGGTIYVFGNHGWQFNIACNEVNAGEGVLFRGVEGYNGPVKLTRELGITKEKYDGKDILSPESPIWLEDDGFEAACQTGTRILGENKSASEYDRNRQWRFYLADGDNNEKENTKK